LVAVFSIGLISLIVLFGRVVVVFWCDASR